MFTNGWFYACLFFIIGAVMFAGIKWPGIFPFFDRGHFGIEAKTLETVFMWRSILRQGKLRLMRIVPLGPTIQFWYSDGRTVVCMKNPNYKGPANNFQLNYISLICKNPDKATFEVRELLRTVGDRPQTAILDIPDSETKLGLVHSYWIWTTIAFRRHAMIISNKPPGYQISRDATDDQIKLIVASIIDSTQS